jgi:hypothetical protein
MPKEEPQITTITTVPDMKTFTEQCRMLKRKSQLSVGLYCILFLCYFVPISANSASDSSSSVTWHSKVTCPELVNRQLIGASDSKHGKIAKERANCNCFNKDPDVFAAQVEQTATETTRYEAPTLTNVAMSKIPIRIRNIVNQSARESSFLEELNNDIDHRSKEAFEHSVIADHRSSCTKQGLQQKKYFKLNNQIPWGNQDYNEAYAPGFYHTNFRLPYNQKTERSSTNKYYTHSFPEDMNRISDTYLKTRHNVPNQFGVQLPRVVVLSLSNPITTNLIWEALSLSSNTQQDSLAMSQQNNGNEELKPIQEVKKNLFTSRGWGARGMPFNVLYMYSRQHKKPVQTSEVARAERLVAPPPLQDFPANGQDHQTVRNALSSTVPAGSNGGVAAGGRRGGAGGGGRGEGAAAAAGGRGGSKSPLSPRWYYSMIPHFHATYGWGQRGK